MLTKRTFAMAKRTILNDSESELDEVTPIVQRKVQMEPRKPAPQQQSIRRRRLVSEDDETDGSESEDHPSPIIRKRRLAFPSDSEDEESVVPRKKTLKSASDSECDDTDRDEIRATPRRILRSADKQTSPVISLIDSDDDESDEFRAGHGRNTTKSPTKVKVIDLLIKEEEKEEEKYEDSGSGEDDNDDDLSDFIVSEDDDEEEEEVGEENDESYSEDEEEESDSGEGSSDDGVSDDSDSYNIPEKEFTKLSKRIESRRSKKKEVVEESDDDSDQEKGHRSSTPKAYLIWCSVCGEYAHPDNFSAKQKREDEDGYRYCLKHTSSSGFNAPAVLDAKKSKRVEDAEPIDDSIPI